MCRAHFVDTVIQRFFAAIHRYAFKRCTTLPTSASAGLLFGRFQREAASQLDGGLDLGCLGFSNSVLAFQLCEQRSVQAG
jgi:hypothetical protein